MPTTAPQRTETSVRRYEPKKLGTDLNARQLLTLTDLHAMGVDFSRVHISRLAAAGKFPKPVRLGDNRIAWLAQEVRDWIAARAAERETA